MLQSCYLTERDLRDFGFKSLGTNVRISSDARVYGQNNISLGNNVRIDDFCTIVAVSGYITLCDYVSIMRGCHLSGVFGIEMKAFSHLAGNCLIYSASDDYSGSGITTVTVPAKYQRYVGGRVVIGRHVIVGTGSIVLGEADIGEGCALGAMSLVHGSLQPWGIYAGAPVKRRKERRKDMLAMETELMLS